MLEPLLATGETKMILCYLNLRSSGKNLVKFVRTREFEGCKSGNVEIEQHSGFERGVQSRNEELLRG